jgi:hypothetical protein
VREQLVSYSRWLEERTGVALSPTTRDDTVSQVPGPRIDVVEIESTAGGSTEDRPWLRPVVVVGVLAALMLAGWSVSRVIVSSEQMVAAESPEDPPGPLFVLPTSFDTTQLENASIFSDHEATAPGHVLVVGSIAADSYNRLALIVVGDRHGSRPPVI